MHWRVPLTLARLGRAGPAPAARVCVNPRTWVGASRRQEAILPHGSRPSPGRFVCDQPPDCQRVRGGSLRPPALAVLARGRGRPEGRRPRPAARGAAGVMASACRRAPPAGGGGGSGRRLVSRAGDPASSCEPLPSGGAGVRAAAPGCGGRADVAPGRQGRPGPVPSRGRFLRKEVIQPQVPLRLPCYDLVPITGFIFGACLAAPTTSDAPHFGGLTGGVYKAQEHIHRGSADPRLLAIPASCGRVAARNPNWGAISAISSALRPGDALSAPL